MAHLAVNQAMHAQLSHEHAKDTAWKLLKGDTANLSLEKLPRWESRPLVLHDAKSGKAMAFSEDWAAAYWASVDDDGNVIKMISNPHKLPSKAYRNPTPRDFVSSAMTKAGEMYMGVGDVCILSISFSDTSTQLIVTLKLPETFGLASNEKDSFGTTLVLRNSYKQEGGMKVAAGAIRFVCTNGCIFGDHTSIGWNHRNTEDAVADKVEEVLETHVDKARKYMAELEEVEMPLITYSSLGNDKEWRLRRTFQDMEDRFTMAIAQMPLTWSQQKLVLEEAYKMQRDKERARDEERALTRCSLTKYDFWNACTAVASHGLKDRASVKDSINSVNLVAGRRDTMGREINKAFAKGAIVDEVLSWDDKKFEDEKKSWIEKGWEKKIWTSVGPVFKLEKKKKRDDSDDTSGGKIAKEDGTDDNASSSDDEMRVISDV